MLRPRLFDSTFDVCHLADVGANQQSLTVEFFAGCGQALRIRANQNHMGAFGLKELGGFQTDARRAASDECDLVV